MLLIEDTNGWNLAEGGRSSLTRLAPADATPDQLSEALSSLQPSNAANPIGILLSSRRVFQSSFPIDEVGRKASSNAIAYRLEAELPFSAEELCLDSLAHEDQLSVFAVHKHETNELIELLRAPSSGAYSVRFVTPASLVLA